MTLASPDRAQIEQLLREHHEAGWGWALSCCRNRQDAEEVLQKAYVKLLDGSARFGGRSAFRTWWLGVIRRTAQEHRRRALLRAVLLPFASAEPASPHEALACRERASMLREAMASLSQRQREVLHLVFYEAMSIADAASVLGIGLGSARQHYERGKANLSKSLAERGLEAR